MHVKAIFNLNVTRERRVELDVIGESWSIISCSWLNYQFFQCSSKCTSLFSTLWLGFEQMKLCKLSRRDMEHSNQIFAVLRFPSA